MSTTYYKAETGEQIYGVAVHFDILCCPCALPLNNKPVLAPIYLTKSKLKDFVREIDGRRVCFCSECGRSLIKGMKI